MLTLTPGSSTQSVTVTGETPQLEEKSVTLDQVMESKDMVQLPLNGRNYLDLGRLAPGAIPGPGASQGSRDETFSAYGNTGLQNAFVMDGARNENYLRGLDNRARDALRPPLDALAEFQVQTSNYSAEFGASAGAVISAVTKSGTNQIHGSAYDFLRNDRMDAADFFAQPGVKPLLVQNQYGVSAGAPIIKNRVWIFSAYEGTHIRSETASLSTRSHGSDATRQFWVDADIRPAQQCAQSERFGKRANPVSEQRDPGVTIQSDRPAASRLLPLAQSPRRGQQLRLGGSAGSGQP